jgi:hypothetical protein
MTIKKMESSRQNRFAGKLDKQVTELKQTENPIVSASKPTKKEDQPSKRLDGQTGRRLDVQPSGVGKNKSADHSKITLYLQKATHTALRHAVIGQKEDMSDIVEKLVADWLKSH